MADQILQMPSADLDEPMKRWAQIYGAETAAGLMEGVEGELPVYEHLRTPKLDLQ